MNMRPSSLTDIFGLISFIYKKTRLNSVFFILKKVKSTVYSVCYFELGDTKTMYVLKYTDEVKKIKSTDIPIMDMASTGSTISKESIINVNVDPSLIVIDASKEPIVGENSKKGSAEEAELPQFLEEFRL